jgi:hypothetical protein
MPLLAKFQSPLTTKSTTKSKMDVAQLMKKCHGRDPPSKTAVKGVVRELGVDDPLLNRVAA